MKNQDKSKKSIALSAIAAGTVALGSMAGTNASATNMFAFEDLGNGAELRSELLTVNNAINFINNNEMELKCGEGDKAKAKDGKAAEHKCGEGKCGDDKKAKADDGKAAKADKKAEKTEEKKEEEKKEVKKDEEATDE